MKSLIYFFILAGTTAAFAGDLDFAIKDGESVCLKREYSKSHLAKHPKQLLSAVYLKITGKKIKSDGEVYSYKDAKFVGVSNQTYFANTAATCDLLADGRLKCGVDCDSGSFHVTPNRDRATIEVVKDYYFPIFKSGTTQYGEDSKAGDQISLPGDVENGTYLVYPTSPKACDAAYRAYKLGKMGGC